MKETNKIFRYESLAQEYNVEKVVLKRLVDDAKNDFPNDEMMAELHVVRALKWLIRKQIDNLEISL